MGHVTDPEVARVGLNEQEAQQKNRSPTPHRVRHQRVGSARLPTVRPTALSSPDTSRSDKILGVTIVVNTPAT